MYCRKCGNQIPNDSKFCIYCGEEVKTDETDNVNFEPNVEGEQYYQEQVVERVTFKSGIKALFNKLFVFEGRSGRAEFNYGLLFLFLLSMALSTLTLASDMSSLLSSGVEDMEGVMTDILVTFESTDIFNPYNLYSLGVSIVFSVFLCAPVYRRLTDSGMKKGLTTALTIVFVLSQLLPSPLSYCLLPLETYEAIYPVISILSTAGTVILFCCMLLKTKYSE